MGGRTQKPKTVNDYANTPIEQFATCGGMPPQQNYQTPTPPMSPAVMPDMSNAPWNQPGQQTPFASPFSGGGFGGGFGQIPNGETVTQGPSSIMDQLMNADQTQVMPGGDSLLDAPAAEEQQGMGAWSASTVMPQTQDPGPEITMAQPAVQPAVQPNLPPQANGGGFKTGRPHAQQMSNKFGKVKMNRGY